MSSDEVPSARTRILGVALFVLGVVALAAICVPSRGDQQSTSAELDADLDNWDSWDSMKIPETQLSAAAENESKEKIKLSGKRRLLNRRLSTASPPPVPPQCATAGGCLQDFSATPAQVSQGGSESSKCSQSSNVAIKAMQPGQWILRGSVPSGGSDWSYTSRAVIFYFFVKLCDTKSVCVHRDGQAKCEDVPCGNQDVVVNKRYKDRRLADWKKQPDLAYSETNQFLGDYESGAWPKIVGHTAQCFPKCRDIPYWNMNKDYQEKEDPFMRHHLSCIMASAIKCKVPNTGNVGFIDKVSNEWKTCHFGSNGIWSAGENSPSSDARQKGWRM